MWIADQWRDYELLDCGGGEKAGTVGQAVSGAAGSAGHLGDAADKNPAWQRADARYLRSADRRRPLGEKSPAGELEGALRGADLPGKAHELQAHGTLSGAGGELGLCHGENPQCRPAHPGAEPVRLHRRRHRGLRRSGAPACAMWTRPRGMVAWARENATPLRTGGRAHPLDRGRLRQICGAGDPPGKTYDAIIMDPPSYGRGPGGEVWKLEDNLYPLCEAVRRGTVGQAAVCS